MSKFKVGDIVKVDINAKYCTTLDSSIFPGTLNRTDDQKIFKVTISVSGQVFYHIDVIDYKGPNYIVVAESYIIGLANEVKTYTMSSNDAVNIIDIACDGWKKKLAYLWGTDIVLKNDIEVSNEFVDEMFEAASNTQKHVLFQIFPHKQVKTLDTLKGNRNHFSADDHDNSMIQVRLYGNLENQGYWLSSCFNWEIVKDNQGENVLVPKEY
jgi:hypothetical protein